MSRPKMIVVDGKPVSEWDIEWVHCHGPGSLDEGEHAVPSVMTGSMCVVSAATLYAEDRARACRPLKFTLAEARKIKNAYWTGTKTIAQLARENDCTTVTISKTVHGITYWYA